MSSLKQLFVNESIPVSCDVQSYTSTETPTTRILYIVTERPIAESSARLVVKNGDVIEIDCDAVRSKYVSTRWSSYLNVFLVSGEPRVWTRL